LYRISIIDLHSPVHLKTALGLSGESFSEFLSDQARASFLNFIRKRKLTRVFEEVEASELTTLASTEDRTIGEVKTSSYPVTGSVEDTISAQDEIEKH
jgi:hypothetical protein